MAPRPERVLMTVGTNSLLREYTRLLDASVSHSVTVRVCGHTTSLSLFSYLKTIINVRSEEARKGFYPRGHCSGSGGNCLGKGSLAYISQKTCILLLNDLPGQKDKLAEAIEKLLVLEKQTRNVRDLRCLQCHLIKCYFRPRTSSLPRH